MSADVLLAQGTRPARARFLANDILAWSPLILVAAALAWRSSGTAAALAVALAGAIALIVAEQRRLRRFDRRWLTRQLDTHRADMEDSADLLFADDAGLSPLQRLQRERLIQRLASGPATDLRPARPLRRILGAWLAGVLAVVAILWTPYRSGSPALAPSDEHVPAVPGVPRLVGQRLRIVPPAYTGLPARDEAALDAKAPQGSRLIWTLHFDPQPDAANLAFPDGNHLALRRDGDDWSVGRTLDRSMLYRVAPHGAEAQPAPPLHRLNAIADSPPQIKVLAPDRGLSLVTQGQRSWALSFEASDDYGVAPNAQLRVTLAQGEGENVTFHERTIAVRGAGSATQKRFAIQLDLAALGFTAGGDLVAQLTVSDNRAPGPQSVRSPSLILRWSSNAGKESGGLDVVVEKVLPAYFRSERQIIIDAEALVKEKKSLAPARFLAKSDGIGVDQRILRLRYGQFLGEEAEGGAKPPPTNDADTAKKPALPVADDDDHAPPPGQAKPAFGSDANVTTEYGHVHDQPEAATLLDPETRATLKQALDQMWQSELNLRQGLPQQALPFAYKALGLIKQVQQATRIFLARVGPELPPIDEKRRMTGKRDGLASRELVLAPNDGIDGTPASIWRALEEPPGAARANLPLESLERWLRANAAQVADPLSLAAAIDAVRREPGCVACRHDLRGLLWALLSRPPANVLRREQGDAGGRRYLDALRQGTAQ